MARIGIFGGTFNPPHKGHIYIAEAALKAAKLDKVIFVPCGNPPHKDSKGIVDAKHRYEMVKILIEDFPQFEISDLELRLTEPSYTAKTLEVMSDLYPDDTLCFLVGGDSLADMKKWYHPELIFKRAEIIAASRKGIDEAKSQLLAEEYSRQFGARVTVLNLPPMEASATDIRNNLVRRRDADDKLHPKVFEYIKQNSLYIQ